MLSTLKIYLIKVFPLFPPEHFSLLVGIDHSYICNMAYATSRFYRHFTIPKKSGKTRDIYEPLPDLKYTNRTERWKNRCMYVQNENKDNYGGNDNAGANESVTIVQNLQSFLCTSFTSAQCTKIRFPRASFWLFFCAHCRFWINKSINLDRMRLSRYT